MRRLLAKFFLLLAVLSPLMIVIDVGAQGIGQGNAIISWINAQQCTDGSQLTIITTDLWREENDSGVFAPLVQLGPGVQSYTDDNLYNGNYCYQGTHTGLCGISPVSRTSSPSGEACKVVNIPGNIVSPLSPTNLTVQ